jgi:predicted Holliday junction resolvase-like endonuclease
VVVVVRVVVVVVMVLVMVVVVVLVVMPCKVIRVSMHGTAVEDKQRASREQTEREEGKQKGGQAKGRASKDEDIERKGEGAFGFEPKAGTHAAQHQLRPHKQVL